MKADARNEQRFIADIDAFEFIAHDVETILHAMEDWLGKLRAALQSNALMPWGLRAHSALNVQAQAINSVLSQSVRAWSQQWAHLAPAQALADSFDDKILLLVFGKFNAGKSSFCNFIADRFALNGKTVEYFYLDAGRVVQTPERFKEGVTETTSRLQGVILAGKLVLVDTPGLHSVSPDNAALTQRFTDSADGVLWLTSSTSPGQVQELDELGRELHRNKPLLPIVTRSDVYDEDEVDGEIRKVLRSKTAQNRAEQEADVQTRAREKLVAMDVDTALLKAPVSISSYLAREQGQTWEALTEAGFERLYAALLAITEPTLDYKRRKQAEVLLHHLEENVMGALNGEVHPMLAQLRLAIDTATVQIDNQRVEVANAVWRSVIPRLPELLETHAAARDVTAIVGQLSTWVSESFSSEMVKQYGDYVIDAAYAMDARDAAHADALIAMIEVDGEAGFEDIVVEHAGTDENLRTVVGVDYQRLHAVLAKAIRHHILNLSRNAAQQCRESVDRLAELAETLDLSIRSHEDDLLALKQRLRSEFKSI